MRKYYAAICEDRNIVRSSSSGGIFFSLAKQVIEEKGVVCGAAFDSDLKVRHILVETFSDLKRLQGSKYVQSEMGRMYKAIASLLADQRTVLFSGVPCQVSGLYSFLEANKIPYFGKLITMEVLCHGVPSPGIFFDYIQELERELNEKIIAYAFRSKDLNKNFTIKIVDESGKVRYRNALTDPYYAGFLSNLTLRPSCYRCRFCGKERKADITAGDFWGIEKAPVSKILKNGCSLVICNSLQGERFLQKCADELLLVQVEEEIAIRSQPQLKNCQRTDRVPAGRDQVFAIWQQEKPEKFLQYLKAVSVNRKKVLVNFFPRWLIRMVKEIVG